MSDREERRGPCINPRHVGRCPGFAPGPKVGRDTFRSCVHCTCHPATHPLIEDEKERKR